ncbi:Emc6p Ecym_7111 [Eremothecium cymbalariae DBVPG|uniref:ER membrane protein complex subunit 6 n=1 Tax=Eremothecium cymbalariae (strain CBS 270.75 / DBVPG 7215 / KCTC 17166 / NRRL Y-17582) TaxID=931890 RepID=G8JVU8_ERECY|nr:hypothetical protein Ecym_7111 [Eremothecium cymbalariae DBVPG\
MNASRKHFQNIESPRSIGFNKSRLLYVHDLTSLVFGCGAGILQLESQKGFGMFIASYIFVSLLFVVWICQLNPQKYFQNPVKDIFFNSLIRELAGFVMSWTFTYALLG